MCTYAIRGAQRFTASRPGDEGVLSKSISFFRGQVRGKTSGQRADKRRKLYNGMTNAIFICTIKDLAGLPAFDQ